jgi:hypothetical protein
MDGRSAEVPRDGAAGDRWDAGLPQDRGAPRDPGSRRDGLSPGAPHRDGQPLDGHHWGGPHWEDALHPEGRRLDGAGLPDRVRRRVPAAGRPERGRLPVHGGDRRSRVRLGAVPILPLRLVVLSSSRSLHQDMNA